MTIDDILQNQILPFETDDEKLKKIFSFFLRSVYKELHADRETGC